VTTKPETIIKQIEKSQKIPLIFENFHLGIVFKPEMIKETIEDYSKVKGLKLEI